ncbi:flagellar hook-length control protein FliK [bacterium]|nr:flagellar hook-length control protein FliK [bacterium]
MYIPQVNQHHHASPSSDLKQPEKGINALECFEGQLVFAEQCTDLFDSVRLNPENRRESEEAVEEKRRDEDLEKTIEVKYWNDQKLQNKMEDDFLARSFGLEVKDQEMRGKTSANQNAADGATHKKEANTEFSQERILNKKPHLLNPIVQQNLQQGQEKEDFLELLKTNSESVNKALVSNFNLPESSENSKETELPKNLPFQFGVKLNRQNSSLKIAPENGSDIKINNSDQLSGKTDQSAQFSLKKDSSLLKNQTEKNPASINKKFVNDLSLASRENQKLEGNQATKETASQVSKQSNIQEVIDNVKILLSTGKDTIIIRLAPEHLGKLEIKLKKSNGVLSGELRVENQEAKDLLQSEFVQLQKDLETQGIKLENFSIYVKGEDFANSEVSKTQKNQRFAKDSEKTGAKKDPVRSVAQIKTPSTSANNNSGLNILA